MHSLLAKSCLVLALLTAGHGISQAQDVELVIRTFSGSQTLVRPVQLVLSPSGSRVAIGDQEGNRIYVIDTDGNLIWTVGDGSTMLAPIIVQFERDDALSYYIKSSQTIFRSTETNPDGKDTVVVDTNSNTNEYNIDKVIPQGGREKGYLVLDRDNSSVFRFTLDWHFDQKLIAHGSRKGRLWSPSDIAIDISGNIVVSDESRCPVQSFTSDGTPLFCGGWNQPEAQRSWNASAIAVTPGDVIWVSDISNRCWRLFDRAGIQIAQYPFESPLLRPNALVITLDNRMFVADDNGSVVVITLPKK